jgi:hypothetical protein
VTLVRSSFPPDCCPVEVLLKEGLATLATVALAG